MTTTRQTELSEINRVSVPADDSKIADPCMLCMSYPIIKRYFADCVHQGSCLKCAQTRMLTMIQEKKYPTCHIDPDCKAKMITNQKSLFQYFREQHKKQWRQFYEITSSLKAKPCVVPNCIGIIQKNRCTKFPQHQYCQKCGDLDHSIKKPCSVSQRQAWAQQYKECPRCKQSYIKIQGCAHITCGNPKCKYQFCQICQKPWNKSHHACSLLSSGTNTSRSITKKQTNNCCAVF